MKNHKCLIGCVFWITFSFLTNAWAQQANPATDFYYDIGGFHYEVTTDSPEAQKWFDRGLAMCIAFNHEEGVRCFERAIAADPSMPMGYWGLAYGLGAEHQQRANRTSSDCGGQLGCSACQAACEKCDEDRSRI